MEAPTLIEQPKIKEIIKEFRDDLQKLNKKVRFGKDKKNSQNAVLSIFTKNRDDGKLMFTFSLFDNDRYLRVNLNRLWHSYFTGAEDETGLDLENLFLAIGFFKRFAKAIGIPILYLTNWDEFFKEKAQKELKDYGFKKCISDRKLENWVIEDWDADNRKYDTSSLGYFLEVGETNYENTLTFYTSLDKQLSSLEQAYPTFEFNKNDNTRRYYFKGHEGQIKCYFENTFIIEEEKLSYRRNINSINEIEPALHEILEMAEEFRTMQNLVSGPLKKFKAFCNSFGMKDSTQKELLHSTLVAEGFNGNYIEEEIHSVKVQAVTHLPKPSEYFYHKSISGNKYTPYDDEDEDDLFFIPIFGLFIVMTPGNTDVFTDKTTAWNVFHEKWLKINNQFLDHIKENTIEN